MERNCQEAGDVGKKRKEMGSREKAPREGGLRGRALETQAFRRTKAAMARKRKVPRQQACRILASGLISAGSPRRVPESSGW